MLEGMGWVPEPPVPEGYEQLLGYMQELGWCGISSGGVVPLDYVEILAYQELMQMVLTPWEAMSIKQLSASYCGGVRSEVAPYMDVEIKMTLATSVFMEAIQ